MPGEHSLRTERRSRKDESTADRRAMSCDSVSSARPAAAGGGGGGGGGGGAAGAPGASAGGVPAVQTISTHVLASRLR